jgi:hypothetical protein
VQLGVSKLGNSDTAPYQQLLGEVRALLVQYREQEMVLLDLAAPAASRASSSAHLACGVMVARRGERPVALMALIQSTSNRSSARSVLSASRSSEARPPD